jgi:hypothetical protein
MRTWLPFFFRPRPLYPVGAQDQAFSTVLQNPAYMSSFYVRGDLRPLKPNTAYTNQGTKLVSIDPMSQGFAGDLALQNLIAMTGQANG